MIIIMIWLKREIGREKTNIIHVEYQWSLGIIQKDTVGLGIGVKGVLMRGLSLGVYDSGDVEYISKWLWHL